MMTDSCVRMYHGTPVCYILIEASEEAIAADGLTKSKILLKVRTAGAVTDKSEAMDPKLAAMIARRRAGT